ncbi:MAG TPA: hypothetical protein PL028_00005 [Bacteroidales bacterium]|nr:hypothetical protein [Bacteroidales bacterium]
MYIGGMKIKKITHGYVIQTYDMEKERYIEQEFVVGGGVEYETGEGEVVSYDEMKDVIFKGKEEPYLPFLMVQPEEG